MASWFLLKGNLAVQNQEKILFCVGKRCFIHRSSLRETSERTLSLSQRWEESQIKQQKQLLMAGDRLQRSAAERGRAAVHIKPLAPADDCKHRPVFARRPDDEDWEWWKGLERAFEEPVGQRIEKRMRSCQNKCCRGETTGAICSHGRSSLHCHHLVRRGHSSSLPGT